MDIISNEPTFFGASISQTEPEYKFTRNGFSCTLWCDGRTVFWQGDEAEEIIRLVDRDGDKFLPQLWDDHEHLSQED